MPRCRCAPTWRPGSVALCSRAFASAAADADDDDAAAAAAADADAAANDDADDDEAEPETTVLRRRCSTVALHSTNKAMMRRKLPMTSSYLLRDNWIASERVRGRCECTRLTQASERESRQVGSTLGSCVATDTW